MSILLIFDISDETPWPVKGVKEWLWVLAEDGDSEKFCLFHAGDTRGCRELVSLLGSSYEGVLISDDFSAYNGYPVAGQQKCLAHLRRHFQRLEKTKGLNNQEIAQVFLNLIDEAFRKHPVWRQTRNETTYRDWAEGFQDRVTTEITTWLKKAGYEAGKLLRSLRDQAKQWWYFLKHPQIPPNNIVARSFAEETSAGSLLNLAERCLRTAVTKRKVCGGSRSLHRFAQTANLLSVIQSCRLQGRSVITFFSRSFTSYCRTFFSSFSCSSILHLNPYIQFFTEEILA